MACDGHAAFGLPQTVSRFVVFRCASAIETKIKHAIAAAIAVRKILVLIMRFQNRDQRSEIRGQKTDASIRPLEMFNG